MYSEIRSSTDGHMEYRLNCASNDVSLDFILNQSLIVLYIPYFYIALCI